MRKISWLLVMVLLVSGLVIGAEVYTAPKVSGKMKIDGNLNEWTKVPAIKLDSSEYLLHANRAWGGPTDFSGKIYVMWDEELLYIAADITDNEVIQEKTGAYLFQGDTIEIYLRMNLAEDDGIASYTNNDYQFGFTPGTNAKAPDWHIWNNSRALTDVQVVVQRTKTGYTLEAAIPVWEMDILLEQGLEIGFDVAIDDVDMSNAADTELQLVWSCLPNGWADPTVFNIVVLGKQK